MNYISSECNCIFICSKGANNVQCFS